MIAARQIAFGGSKRKPYDAEIEYLESTGTQYIDTGIVCSSSLGIEVDISILELNSTTYPQFFGCYSLDTYVSWGGWSNNATQYAVGVEKFVTVDNPPIPYRCVSSINYLLDGLISIKSSDLDGDQKEVYEYSRGANDFKVMLFGGGDKNGVVSYDGKCKIHSAKITEEADVIRDFIPVRFTNENGETEGAMFDKVSGELLRNAGTGAFVLGADI